MFLCDIPLNNRFRDYFVAIIEWREVWFWFWFGFPVLLDTDLPIVDEHEQDLMGPM